MVWLFINYFLINGVTVRRGSIVLQGLSKTMHPKFRWLLKIIWSTNAFTVQTFAHPLYPLPSTLIRINLPVFIWGMFPCTLCLLFVSAGSLTDVPLCRLHSILIRTGLTWWNIQKIQNSEKNSNKIKGNKCVTRNSNGVPLEYFIHSLKSCNHPL